MGYMRHLGNLEQDLDNLRKSQKLKVEEMKKKMKYYEAKTLIERYEGKNDSSNQNTPTKPQPPLNSPSQPLPFLGTPPPGSVHSTPSMEKKISANTPSGERQVQPPPPLHVPQLQQPALNPGIPKQIIPEQRTWIDRILDVIVGDDTSASSKFALICERCFSHNGLCFPEEIYIIRYQCFKCGHLNPPRKRGSSSMAGEAFTTTTANNNDTNMTENDVTIEKSPANESSNPDTTADVETIGNSSSTEIVLGKRTPKAKQEI